MYTNEELYKMIVDLQDQIEKQKDQIRSLQRNISNSRHSQRRWN